MNSNKIENFKLLIYLERFALDEAKQKMTLN